MNPPDFFEAITVTLLSVFSTCWLNRNAGFSKIQASSLASFLFLAALTLHHHYPCLPLHSQIDSILFYGATFIGMTSSKVANKATLLTAAILYALLYQAGNDFHPTLGGKLGFIATISVTLTLGLNTLIRLSRQHLNSKQHPSPKIP